MNTARIIIKKFGGQTKLAELIGKKQSTVQYWAKKGTIPAKWQTKLLEIAQKRGVLLSPKDFMSPTSIVPEIVEDSEKLPVALLMGTLKMPGNLDIPCFVLDDGRRVISRTGATNALTEKSSSDLESYLKVDALKNHLPEKIYDQMIDFLIEGVTKTTRGVEAELFLDICKAYVNARDDGSLKTARQIDIAIKAGRFLSACSKVGLIALIDEATGYQYVREEDALQFKLKLYLEEEMRPWEKTFPDELWLEFGRLTNWQGPINQRPKYWGKLVIELVYEYLDPDVAEWLKTNAPKPIGNMSYHRWLTSQYGLKRLTEHIWMLIGISKTCYNLVELREKMAIQFGRQYVQMNMFLPIPAKKAKNM
ncbi:FIG00532455: hypothetical protein [Olavius sp. associated proteobacterium Delta 1]|nr:FIG00532455: hypothetical protein [Olavius sp. associated proteobacterium Delta 1]